MKKLKRFLPQALLLSSIGLTSPLVAGDVEGNAFIVSKLAGAEHPRTRNEKAHKLFNKGELKESAKVFEALLSKDPSNGQAWFNHGVVQLNLKNSGSAIHSFHTALKSGMGNKARFHLAYALVENGEVLGAMHHLKTLLREHDQHELGWTLLGRCYETYHRYAQAKECYEKALAIDPELGQALFLLENLPQATQGKIPNLNREGMGKAAPEDETSPARSFSPLPLSRVLSQEGKTTKAHTGGLAPLHQTYHLSTDLPSGVKIAPTEEADWSAVQQSTQQKAPVAPPKMEPPKAEIPIDNLDI